MSMTDFLRRQAENCLRTARGCFDLASAERLRLMAAEFRAKAAEIDAANTDAEDRDRQFSDQQFSWRRMRVTGFQRN